MDLAEGGGRQRFVVELFKQGADVRLEFLGDDRPNVVGGNGFDVVLKPRERVGVCLRQEVVARGQELAELDVRGAHRFEVGGEPLGAFAGVALLVGLCEKLVGAARAQEPSAAVADQ